jgi:TonB family protein
MRTGLALLTALLILTPGKPVATSEQEICLSQFVAPVYAPFVRQTNVQGTVHVTVAVNSNGRPTKVTAVKEGSHPELTDALRNAAVEAVRQWRFCPTSKERTMTLTFNFRLRETPPSSNDNWFPTEVSFESPATVNITTTAFRVVQWETK